MVKFDIDFEDPHRKMHIYSDDDVVNLTFSIGDVRKDVANRFNLIKTNFRQFVGCYNGYFKIKDKKYEIKNLNGLFELHDSIW